MSFFSLLCPLCWTKGKRHWKPAKWHWERFYGWFYVFSSPLFWHPVHVLKSVWKFEMGLCQQWIPFPKPNSSTHLLLFLLLHIFFLSLSLLLMCVDLLCFVLVCARARLFALRASQQNTSDSVCSQCMQDGCSAVARRPVSVEEWSHVCVCQLGVC